MVTLLLETNEVAAREVIQRKHQSIAWAWTPKQHPINLVTSKITNEEQLKLSGTDLDFTSHNQERRSLAT